MGRLDTVKKEFPNINWDTLKAFDPSKSQKYLRWLGKNYSFYSPEELKNLILNFERQKDNLSKKDINKYSADILAEELNSLAPSRREGKNIGAIELTEGVPQGTKIFLIEGEKAAQQYFANTRWCISNFDTFLSYSVKKNMFVVIKDNTKLCISIDLANRNFSTMFDAQDRSIPRNTLEVLASFGKNEACLLDLVKICEEYSQKYKNFWFKSNSSKMDLEKALSLTSINRLLKMLRGNSNIFTDEKTLDKLLSLTSHQKVFDTIIINHSYERTIIPVLQFFYKNKEKYKELANLFASSDKRLYANRNGYNTVSAIWMSLDSSPEIDVLLKRIKRVGGIAKLLQNKEIAKIISLELVKQLQN